MRAKAQNGKISKRSSDLWEVGWDAFVATSYKTAILQKSVKIERYFNRQGVPFGETLLNAQCSLFFTYQESRQNCVLWNMKFGVYSTEQAAIFGTEISRTKFYS